MPPKWIKELRALMYHEDLQVRQEALTDWLCRWLIQLESTRVVNLDEHERYDIDLIKMAEQAIHHEIGHGLTDRLVQITTEPYKWKTRRMLRLRGQLYCVGSPSLKEKHATLYHVLGTPQAPPSHRPREPPYGRGTL